ncbi:MAG: HU family DNA-binding protein [Bacteroidota bacterium]
MRKADIVNEIMNKTGIDKVAVEAIIESIMETVRSSVIQGEPIYLRGFGTFKVKKRANKIGRNIFKNTTVRIPAHNVPIFKPCKEFVSEVKIKVKL